MNAEGFIGPDKLLRLKIDFPSSHPGNPCSVFESILMFSERFFRACAFRDINKCSLHAYRFSLIIDNQAQSELGVKHGVIFSPGNQGALPFPRGFQFSDYGRCLFRILPEIRRRPAQDFRIIFEAP